jgi:hypothetical protein
MIDYCTAFPDRLGSLDWSQCCRLHDLAYADSLTAKLTADLDLARCVADAAGWPLAILMGAGVMLFGLVPWLIARPRR